MLTSLAHQLRALVWYCKLAVLSGAEAQLYYIHYIHIFFGTIITFLGVLPSNHFWDSSCSIYLFLFSSFDKSTGNLNILTFIFPLNETWGIYENDSTKYFASKILEMLLSYTFIVPNYLPTTLQQCMSHKDRLKSPIAPNGFVVHDLNRSIRLHQISEKHSTTY